MAALVILARTPLRLHSACRSRRGSARKSMPSSSLRAAATVLLSCHLGLSSSPPSGLLLSFRSGSARQWVIGKAKDGERGGSYIKEERAAGFEFEESGRWRGLEFLFQTCRSWTPHYRVTVSCWSNQSMPRALIAVVSSITIQSCSFRISEIDRMRTPEASPYCTRIFASIKVCYEFFASPVILQRLFS